MAIVAKFDVQGMTSATYDTIMQELTGIGQAAPAGRLYHVAYVDGNSIQVIDVYDSPAQLEAFGAKLMPILAKHGVVAKPTVLPAHNIVIG